jgi:hypothetical protein
LDLDPAAGRRRQAELRRQCQLPLRRVANADPRIGLALFGGGGDGGTFSAKGPYFISWRSGNGSHEDKAPRQSPSRERQLGFKPDHYNQDGVIREKGVAVIEYATKKCAPVTIRQFAERLPQ